MEPNKLDNEFRTKLNHREITPSAHAWDRLDAMLNDAEDKKPVRVRRLTWLYVAAGFIGLLFAGTMFFSNNQPALPADTVAAGTEVTTDTVKVSTPVHNDVIVHPREKIIYKTHSQSAVAGTGTVLKQHKNPEKNLPASERMAPATRNETQIAGIDKVQDLMPSAQGENPKATINPVEAHVDELLADAGQSSKKPKTIKVDAGTLLSQVDGELELSFREKAIKAISKNYKNVKVALANRNQE